MAPDHWAIGMEGHLKTRRVFECPEGEFLVQFEVNVTAVNLKPNSLLTPCFGTKNSPQLWVSNELFWVFGSRVSTYLFSFSFSISCVVTSSICIRSDSSKSASSSGKSSITCDAFTSRGKATSFDGASKSLISQSSTFSASASGRFWRRIPVLRNGLTCPLFGVVVCPLLGFEAEQLFGAIRDRASGVALLLSEDDLMSPCNQHCFYNLRIKSRASNWHQDHG